MAFYGAKVLNLCSFVLKQNFRQSRSRLRDDRAQAHRTKTSALIFIVYFFFFVQRIQIIVAASRTFDSPFKFTCFSVQQTQLKIVCANALPSLPQLKSRTNKKRES